jgi:hypothetical protein
VVGYADICKYLQLIGSAILLVKLPIIDRNGNFASEIAESIITIDRNGNFASEIADFYQL